MNHGLSMQDLSRAYARTNIPIRVKLESENKNIGWKLVELVDCRYTTGREAIIFLGFMYTGDVNTTVELT